MPKPYMIRVSSQKGGVGKTTISTNLAAAIRSYGYKTLLVDMDFVNPSVGFHLGLEETNAGVQAVILKRAKLEKAVSIHAPSGLHVLPGEIKTSAFIQRPGAISSFMQQLRKSNYNFVVVDTAPGYDSGIALKNFDEDIIVTVPDMPSSASAVRLSDAYDKLHLKHSLIVNKVGYSRWELNVNEIADMYEGDVAGVLPADEAIPMSIAAHIPAYLYKPRARFSKAMKGVSNKYASRGGGGAPVMQPVYASFWQRFIQRFRKKY